MDGWMDRWMDEVVKKKRSLFPTQDKGQDTLHVLQIKPYEHNHSQRRSSQPLLHGHQTHFRPPFTATPRPMVLV